MDILGRVIRSELPQEKENGAITFQKTTTVYDTAGNVTAEEEQIEDDRTAKTEYTYDKLGSLVMVKSCLEDGAAQYVQYVYDTEGNKVRQFTGMTSPLTISVSERSGATDGNAEDTFSYAGKTYSITVSGKKKSDTIRETKYEYDSRDQLVSCTDPEGRTETYTYDVYGNLTKIVDKNGNTQKNAYDYQNRLTEMAAKEKETGKETVHTYTYNAYGDVASQDDTSFTYGDISGQVTEETTTLAGNRDVVKTCTYDSEGNRSALTITAGGRTQLSLRYTYDGESRLAAITDEKGNKVVGYGYDTDGNLAERTVAGNNLTTTYAYDYQNHLTAMTNQTGSAVISEYTSEYLLNGQKSGETAAVMDGEEETETKIATYTYDLLGRLTRETKTGSEDITYTYDSNNNRKEMTTGNQVTSYKYNKNDELLCTDTLNTETKEDSVVLYKNDKNGNQLATVNRYDLPDNQEDELYADLDITLGDNRLNENVVNHYNALNQLTQTLTKNYKVSYTYDAEGLRASKTVNGETTLFVWDGGQLVLELSEDGEVKRRYIRGNDLVCADGGEDTEKQYYVTDPHGNVVQLTDEEGVVTKTYEYDSFGNEVKPEKKDDNPFRYCGEYYDKETEEIYLRARYYQPAVGRFLSRDIYTGEEDEPLSLHLYTYCGNDGVNAWDPSGFAFRDTENLRSYYAAMSIGDTRWKWDTKDIYGKHDIRGGEFIDYKNGGEVYEGPILTNLNVCTDGKKTKRMKKSNYYDDKKDRKNKTACFGKKIAADEIPYIVVPPSKSAYKFSSGVIIDREKQDYLYCVVAEIGPSKDEFGNDKVHMDEVSIYAAWKMYNMDVSGKKVNPRYRIGDSSPEDKMFQIIAFKNSSPAPKKTNNKYGWKYKKSPKKFRKQIKQIGEQYYNGLGFCLN